MKSAILLVDDNAIQAATRQAILERAGNEVAVAAEGSAALDELTKAASRDKFGLLITDHLMPGMDGPELVEKVRDLGFDLPILVLSGLPDAEEAYENLNVTFRLKPFRPDSLIALAGELLRGRARRTA